MTAQEWARVQLAHHMYDELCACADKLSTWEASFASSIKDLLDEERVPTTPQLDKLREIYEAYTA